MTVLADDQTDMPPAELLGGDRGTELGKHQQLGYTVLALVIAAVAFGTAWWLHGNAPSTYRITSQWGAFTGLFILALAIERALEPFSRKLGPDTTKRKHARVKALARAQVDEIAERNCGRPAPQPMP